MLTSLSHRPQARRAELFPTSPRLLDFHGVLFREAEGNFEPGSCVTAEGVASFVIATCTKADEPRGPVRCIVGSFDGRSQGVFLQSELRGEE